MEGATSSNSRETTCCVDVMNAGLDGNSSGHIIPYIMVSFSFPAVCPWNHCEIHFTFSIYSLVQYRGYNHYLEIVCTAASY
jgi:hypothetical protein